MIHLNAEELKQTVAVPAEFIRTYLPASPGEYVKVYLYLLMLSRETEEDLSVGTLAHALSMTEEEVLESLRFWKKQGLLELEFKNERLKTIAFRPVSRKHMPGSLSAENIRALKKDSKEAAQLIFVSEQYLKRPLSRSDINVLLFFLEDLKLPLDVCEYVVEYCVSKGHANIKYIEKVGMAWHDKGITSVNEAKEQSGMWNKYHYEVLKAFGIHGRDPVTKEAAFIEKWRKEYGFSMPIISEACARTLSATGKPSFAYADGILSRWHENKVTGFEDIEKLDRMHKVQLSKNGGASDRGAKYSVPAAANVSYTEVDFKKVAEDSKRLEQAYRAFPRLSGIDKEVSELSMKKARINLGISSAEDFDLDQRLAALTEERKTLLMQAGYSRKEAEEMSAGTEDR